MILVSYLKTVCFATPRYAATSSCVRCLEMRHCLIRSPVITALQAVELKIVKAQEQVSKTKKAYDTAIANQTNWEPLCKECHDKKTGSGL